MIFTVIVVTINQCASRSPALPTADAVAIRQLESHSQEFVLAYGDIRADALARDGGLDPARIRAAEAALAARLGVAAGEVTLASIGIHPEDVTCPPPTRARRATGTRTSKPATRSAG